MKEVEIKDTFILSFSLIVAVVGVVVLFFLSTMMEDDLSFSGLIQGTDDGNIVDVKGVIQKKTVRDNVVFLTLATETFVDATVFTSDDLDVVEGEHVFLRGEVQTYEGKKSLIVEKLEKT